MGALYGERPSVYATDNEVGLVGRWERIRCPMLSKHHSPLPWLRVISKQYMTASEYAHVQKTVEAIGLLSTGHTGGFAW